MKNKKPIIFVIASEKGGVGKSTAVINLTHALSLMGFKVVAVDTDNQRSLCKWDEANSSSIINCVEISPKSLKANLQRNHWDKDIIIIDSASRVDGEHGAIIKIADVVIIPVQHGPLDIWAVVHTVCNVKDRQEIADGCPEAAFLVNRVIKNSILNRHVTGYLEEYGIPVLSSKISQRIAYANVCMEGKTIFSSPPVDKDAHAEFTLLVDEIIEKYITPRGVFPSVKN